MDELARLKQVPVSGLRQVYFDAVVAPRSATIGADRRGLFDSGGLPFALPTPGYNLPTYSILPVLQVPESSSGDTTVGLGSILLNVFVAPTKSDSFEWGAGVAAVLRTQFGDTPGSYKVGLGPAAIILYEQKKWSAGAVLQNVWSLGGTGPDEVNDFSASSSLICFSLEASNPPYVVFLIF